MPVNSTNESKPQSHEREDPQGQKFAEFDKDDSNRDQHSINDDNFDILEDRPTDL